MSEHQKFEFSTPMAVVAAGFFIAAAILYSNAYPAAPAVAGAGGQNLPQNVNVAAPTAQDHRWGSASAKVTLIEYSDFECPFCNLVHSTLKSIVDGSGGEVAWVMRNFPLNSIHPEANPAANAAECVAEQLGNDGWFAFADAVFANQSKMSASYYAQLAGQLGADRAKYSACIGSGKYQAKIDAEARDVQNNGGQGTPYTIVYGYGKQVPVSGAQPAANFYSVISSIK